MRILFLFQRFSFKSSTIYLDLVRECVRAGHSVFLLAGTTNGDGDPGVGDVPSGIVKREGCNVAYVPLPDQFHAGRIKKGLVQLLIEPLFIRTLKKLLWNESIDIIAYPTPPVTLAQVVKTAKDHYGAVTYLMLKDIFPQNAADLDMMDPRGLIFRHFRRVEKKLYDVSDHIGCMSEANIRYMAAHNPYTADRLELFPNTVSIRSDGAVSRKDKKVPGDDTVRFVIGGNLGEPQAVDLLMEGIRMLSDAGYERARFLIIGSGTKAEYVRDKIAEWSLRNVVYHSELTRDEYEMLLEEQDVGIISLNFRFTIPNFPSRLLSYMQLGKPVLVVSDSNTDIGDVVVNRAQCGFHAPSEKPEDFVDAIKEICSRSDELSLMGRRSRRYLEENYDVRFSVKILEKAVTKKQAPEGTGAC